MNRRTFLILISAALVLIAILLLTPSSIENNGGGFLIPGLNEKLNDVTRLSISAGGGQPVATLERGESQWTVRERSGYPADVSKIRRNLIALGNATIIEEKTSDPALYDRLGIEDIEQSAATGLKLDIYWPGQDGDTPTSLIVGDTGVRGKMAYVRRVGETHGLMVSADLDLGENTMDWLAPELVDIPAADIHAVTISHPDGERLRIEKQSRDDLDFSILDIPDGKELLYPSVANSLGSLLANLSLDDVAPAATVDMDGTEPVVARFQTFDGLVIEAKAYTIDDEIRIRFHAEAEEPGESTEPVPFSAIAQQAEDIDARLSPWVYSLPSFKSEQLVKRLVIAVAHSL